MNATSSLPVVGIDLAKNVFEVAVADRDWRVVERARLSRSQFERWFANRVVGQVVMEACGSAHHWGRWFGSQGIDAQLLPARDVRAYVKRPELADRRTRQRSPKAAIPANCRPIAPR